MAITAAESQTGTALEARLYLDPDVLEQERTRILERSWLLAAHVSALPEPGGYLTTTVGTQPVLVVRDEEGHLRAFRNVCRHRASRLLSGSGSCGKAIRCLYHGWTYRLDGRLIGVPEGRSIPGLDKSALGLYPVRVEELCGLVFVNLDPDAVPLAEQVAGLPERLARYGIDQLQPCHRWAGSEPANWKVVVENYLEGYHVPIAHPGLMRLLDYKLYQPEVHENWIWFECPMRDKPSGNPMERAYQRLVKPMPGLTEEDRSVWRYVVIFPNTTIDLYPDQVLTWRIDPDGPYKTSEEALAYRHPHASVRTRLAQYANRKVNKLVGEEDLMLIENVQAGLESRGWSPGPLSGREVAVAWFADRIRAGLAGGG